VSDSPPDLPPRIASDSLPTARVPTPRSRRFLFGLLRIALGVLIVLAWFQRSLIYHPTKTGPLEAKASRLSQAVVDVTVTSHDGLTLHGWLALASQRKSAAPLDVKSQLAQQRPFVIVFPGNAGNRENREYLLDAIGSLGADAMIFDYRGYAENPGKPSEANFAQDAQSIWKFATDELKVPPRRIVIYGESLGGGVATRLAGDLCSQGIEPGGLVVQSTFNSLVDAGGHHFPFLPVSLILIDRFRSDLYITKVTCPILQIHGENDSIVPLRLGQKLFAAAPAKSSNGTPKVQLLLPNRDHNDVYAADRTPVMAALQKFLTAANPE
jgi:uncharacterized protein